MKNKIKNVKSRKQNKPYRNSKSVFIIVFGSGKSQSIVLTTDEIRMRNFERKTLRNRAPLAFYAVFVYLMNYVYIEYTVAYIETTFTMG